MDKDLAGNPSILAGLYENGGGKSRWLLNNYLFRLLPNPLSNILPLSSFLSHTTRRQKMAKKPMTKSQLVSHFSITFEISKKMASAILDEVAALAVSETKKTGSFTVPGIGKLVLVKRKARMGRNPGTGEVIKIAAKTVVKMRIAKAAKDAIVPGKK
jgi:DNA-binding protein HU-beta